MVSDGISADSGGVEAQAGPSNFFRDADPEKFYGLIGVVERFPVCYATVLSHSRRDLGGWLDMMLEPVASEYRALRAGYRIPTRNKIYMALHGVRRPLKCPICGKTVFKKVLDIRQDHDPYCCMKCAGAAEAPKAKQA